MPPAEDRSTPPDGDALSSRRQVVCVLRLVVNDGGGLSHGEVVDVAGRVHGRFGDWDALVQIIRNWLEHDEGRRGDGLR